MNVKEKEDQHIKLSIIVPVYNVEMYIRPCIESIFSQGLDEKYFEVIIINDGTEDRSMEMIQDLIIFHKNIIVINQKNQGMSIARNVGIAAAKGHYVFMSDSDDILIENSLPPLLEIAMESKADVVIADYFEMTNKEIESTKLNIPNFEEVEIKEKTGEQMFFEFLKPRNYTVWRSLYKNEFLKRNKLSFFPGIYCQDKPFIHAVYLKAKKCIRVSWPIYIYRRHQESISYSMSDQYAKDYCKIIDIMWNMASDIELSPKMREKMYDHTFNAFTMLSSRLIHEYKSVRKSNQIIDYLNKCAPQLNFKHGLKQKLYTKMLKNCPHTYILLRYIYSMIWEDRIGPILHHSLSKIGR